VRDIALAAATYALGVGMGTVLADTLAQAAVGSVLTVVVALAIVRGAERAGVVEAQ